MPGLGTVFASGDRERELIHERALAVPESPTSHIERTRFEETFDQCSGIHVWEAVGRVRQAPGRYRVHALS